jgi:hypothetical protein
MTEKQWTEVKGYLVRRLEKVEEFSISAPVLERKFNLTAPFYQEMIRYAKRDKAPFNCHGAFHDEDGDPTDPIRFSRRS